jgi:hypothetical protein
VAFAISGALFAAGALLAVALIPSRRRLAAMRNAALSGPATPAADTAELADVPVAGH